MKPVDFLETLEERGYFFLPRMVSPEGVSEILARLAVAFQAAENSEEEFVRNSLLLRDGALCGARNLIAYFPEAHAIWQKEPLVSTLLALLGPGFGLVRCLYFDKPPGHTWALPWHQDCTIAVQHHPQALGEFKNPTIKAGVPHLEAPRRLLQRMIIVRLHLDRVTESNGPLQVAPGSHRHQETKGFEPDQVDTLLCEAGDVLVIRPLVFHSSPCSAANAQEHRRILHLEFAPADSLPEPLQWYHFLTRRTEAETAITRSSAIT